MFVCVCVCRRVCVCEREMLRSNLSLETACRETYASLVFPCIQIFVCVLASAKVESDRETEQLK